MKSGKFLDEKWGFLDIKWDEFLSVKNKDFWGRKMDKIFLWEIGTFLEDFFL
jgi:hypothetical protein